MLILIFGIFLLSCVTPNKLKNKAELENLIVANIKNDLILRDTVVFDSWVFRCANSTYAEMIALYAPIEEDTNFIKLIENQIDKPMLFYRGEIKELIDSSCSNFREDSISCFTDNKTTVNISGRCVSRRKLVVYETYRTDTTRKRFYKIYKFKKRKWQLFDERLFK
ncbi:MAG: hypothetical protein ACPGVD_09485 [Flavobacteriales bacterium]